MAAAHLLVGAVVGGHLLQGSLLLELGSLRGDVVAAVVRRFPGLGFGLLRHRLFGFRWNRLLGGFGDRLLGGCRGIQSLRRSWDLREVLREVLRGVNGGPQGLQQVITGADGHIVPVEALGNIKPGPLADAIKSGLPNGGHAGGQGHAHQGAVVGEGTGPDGFQALAQLYGIELLVTLKGTVGNIADVFRDDPLDPGAVGIPLVRPRSHIGQEVKQAAEGQGAGAQAPGNVPVQAVEGLLPLGPGIVPVDQLQILVQQEYPDLVVLVKGALKLQCGGKAALLHILHGDLHIGRVQHLPVVVGGGHQGQLREAPAVPLRNIALYLHLCPVVQPGSGADIGAGGVGSGNAGVRLLRHSAYRCHGQNHSQSQ